MLPDDDTEHRNDDNNNEDSSVNKNVDCGSKKPFTQYFKIEVERRKKVLVLGILNCKFLIYLPIIL